MLCVELAAPKSLALAIFSACVLVLAHPAGAAVSVVVARVVPFTALELVPAGGNGELPPWPEHEAVTSPTATASAPKRFMMSVLLG
jgi:hypothetical protein